MQHTHSGVCGDGTQRFGCDGTLLRNFNMILNLVDATTDVWSWGPSYKHPVIEICYYPSPWFPRHLHWPFESHRHQWKTNKVKVSLVNSHWNFVQRHLTSDVPMDFAKQHGAPPVPASNISPHLSGEARRSRQDSGVHICLKGRGLTFVVSALVREQRAVERTEHTDVDLLQRASERKGFTVPLQLKAHLAYHRRILLHLNWEIDGSLDMEPLSSTDSCVDVKAVGVDAASEAESHCSCADFLFQEDCRRKRSTQSSQGS